MSENKTGKYFKYAIGEIVLVVIGILIALSINNWNEQRKTKISEISYIESIKIDLIGDTETINFIVENTKKRIAANELILEQLRSFDTITDSRPLYKLMRDNVGFIDLKVQDHTIETLKNSGNIEIINSKPIRGALQTYYDTVEIIYIQQSIMNKSTAESERAKFFNYLESEKGILNNTKVPFDDRAKANLPDAYAFLNHWVSNLKTYVNLLNNLNNRNLQLIESIQSDYPNKVEQ
jgi:hypothetical protein